MSIKKVIPYLTIAGLVQILFVFSMETHANQQPHGFPDSSIFVKMNDKLIFQRLIFSPFLCGLIIAVNFWESLCNKKDSLFKGLIKSLITIGLSFSLAFLIHNQYHIEYNTIFNHNRGAPYLMFIIMDTGIVIISLILIKLIIGNFNQNPKLQKLIDKIPNWLKI